MKRYVLLTALILTKAAISEAEAIRADSTQHECLHGPCNFGGIPQEQSPVFPPIEPQSVCGPTQ